jgi:betaine-aldehyde dehydrogenase
MGEQMNSNSSETMTWVEQSREHSVPEQPFKGQLFINGDWREASDGGRITRTSPAYRKVVSDLSKATVADTQDAISAARQAFDKGDWSEKSGAERAAILNKIADLVMQNQQQFALQEVLESGKPISQAMDEIEWAVDLWRYAAVCARSLHGDSFNNLGSDMLAMVVREPIGVVSIITPWNFPFLILSQKLPFALAAGCTAVVKPSELTSGTTVMIAKILVEAGVPAGVVNILVGEGHDVGALMTSHEDVDMVTFTGSSAVGKKLTAVAAQSLKKVSLELGGKNPQIIFPDCDWDAAVDAVVFGTFFNAGECCNSGSRILVHESIATDFQKAVEERAAKVPFGDPLCKETKVGAIVSVAHLNVIQNYLKVAVEEGAQISLGGSAVEHSGLYMQPTIVSNVTRDMQIAREEVFGPVLSVLTFSDLDEAISIANDCFYGLSAGVWSANIDNCLKVARSVKAGTVWINGWMSGYPELPFGGYKQSGQGRELGRAALDEFTEQKTIQMHIGERTGWWLPKNA